MTLPTSLTTVTTLSKILALILFILFPFVGFYVGMQYEAIQTVKNLGNQEPILTKSTSKPSPSPTTTDKYALDVPSYQAPWKQLSATEAETFGKDALMFESLANGKTWGQVGLTGTLWTRTIALADLDIFSDF